ncbi:TPA: metallophosphoesterase [archaeon]|jgi:putative SbcD/Mre11-related phosphoesterase|uniref:Metallophosphoesterase n=1 Tax=Candidatus Undinarchaeum marinum TaxID=2756141 RepID=A0A832XL55_9ARCH|nr:metallophosphoesterase [Candidatus Undinarchaeum marinum]
MNLTNDIEIKGLALYIPKHKAAIISDLQLGYEENLISQGVLVPFTQFEDTKERLSKDLNDLELDTIIVNGDLKHEFGRISRQEWKDVLRIIDFLSSFCKNLILVKGNHDIVLSSITKKKGVGVVDSFQLGDIFITHGHEIPEIPKGVKSIIIGHDHPAVKLRDGDVSETYKCYLKGKWKRKTLIVQPSSFLLTEGTDVLHYTLKSPFLEKGIENFEIFVVADKPFYFGKLKDLR